jgi:hypothetical protein
VTHKTIVKASQPTIGEPKVFRTGARNRVRDGARGRMRQRHHEAPQRRAQQQKRRGDHHHRDVLHHVPGERSVRERIEPRAQSHGQHADAGDQRKILSASRPRRPHGALIPDLPPFERLRGTGKGLVGGVKLRDNLRQPAPAAGFREVLGLLGELAKLFGSHGPRQTFELVRRPDRGIDVVRLAASLQTLDGAISLNPLTSFRSNTESFGTGSLMKITTTISVTAITNVVALQSFSICSLAA